MHISGYIKICLKYYLKYIHYQHISNKFYLVLIMSEIFREGHGLLVCNNKAPLSTPYRRVLPDAYRHVSHGIAYVYCW